MKNTHLTLEDRKKIQEGLENELSSFIFLINCSFVISKNLLFNIFAINRLHNIYYTRGFIFFQIYSFEP